MKSYFFLVALLLVLWASNSPVEGALCSGKKIGFYCVNTTTAAWCYGPVGPAYFPCPLTTDCSCGYSGGWPCSSASTGCSGTPGSQWDDEDSCPDDPAKTQPGVCGCGISDTDTDSDGTPDCKDLCPLDAHKITPGVCGCGVLESSCTSSSSNPSCSKLFGGWLALYDYTTNPTSANPEQWVTSHANYIILANIDAGAISDTLPSTFVRLAKQLPDDTLVLVSLSIVNQNNFLASSSRSKAAAAHIAQWMTAYDIDGIDIDPEGRAIEVNPPLNNFVTFITELKRLKPHAFIALDVYGNPHGTLLGDYLINNLMTAPSVALNPLIDVINIMAYETLGVAREYVEWYTKGPFSSGDDQLNRAVPAERVMVGLKSSNGYGSSCSVSDYTQWVSYVKSSGIRGLTFWAINLEGASGTSWYRTGCGSTYSSMWNSLCPS